MMSDMSTLAIGRFQFLIKKDVAFAKVTRKWYAKNVKWLYVYSKIAIVL